MSSINHTNQITLGDIIGSSITNIALIIGTSALLFPIRIDQETRKRNLPLSIIIQIVFAFFLLTGDGINRVESTILLLALIVYLYYLILTVIGISATINPIASLANSWISRPEGMILVALYFTFLAFSILNGH